MSININEILEEARLIQNRLVDSDFHDSEAAVPPIAEKASEIIGKLTDLLSKSVINPKVLEKLAQDIAISEFLCDPPESTTFESLGESLNLDDSFPEDVVVWEPFEDCGHETVLGYMENLASSIKNGIQALIDEQPSDIEPKTSKVPVGYWNSYSNGDLPNGSRPFVMEITDQRGANGQIYVDIAPESGNIDDIMSLALEINRLPDDSTDRQCAHLHFDGSNLAISIFKDGDGYILRPETDVSIENVKLANSELAWRIASR